MCPCNVHRVPVLSFDAKGAQPYARLLSMRAHLDRLIGAQVLSLGLTLITNNEVDFADLPALLVEDWTG